MFVRIQIIVVQDSREVVEYSLDPNLSNPKVHDCPAMGRSFAVHYAMDSKCSTRIDILWVGIGLHSIFLGRHHLILAVTFFFTQLFARMNQLRKQGLGVVHQATDFIFAFQVFDEGLPQVLHGLVHFARDLLDVSVRWPG